MQSSPNTQYIIGSESMVMLNEIKRNIHRFKLLISQCKNVDDVHRLSVEMTNDLNMIEKSIDGLSETIIAHLEKTKLPKKVAKPFQATVKNEPNVGGICTTPKVSMKRKPRLASFDRNFSRMRTSTPIRATLMPSAVRKSSRRVPTMAADNQVPTKSVKMSQSAGNAAVSARTLSIMDAVKKLHNGRNNKF